MESCHFQVPWYSMQEWSFVYSQIYSSNIGDMKKAYRRLLVWKTRVENLPAGVECTLGILQVRLREMEVTKMKERVLSHEDLQLMYSTAIIRFLNMIAELEQQGRTQGVFSTLYCKAQGMDIPSWIVNLRHDAAHSTTLPPLHSLKSAADFIFNWLNDYYWKNEAQHTQDYFIETSNTCRVYKRKMRTLFSLFRIYLDLATSDSRIVSEETLETLTAFIPAFSTRDKDASLNRIIHSILSPMLQKEAKKQDILEHIVEDTEFLNCNTENIQSRTKLHKIWAPILSMLNKHSLLLDFMRLLIEVLNLSQDDEAKSEQTAMWINEICRGFLKLERCLHIQLDLSKRDIGTSLSSKQQFKLILKVADKNYTNLRSAMVLKGKLPAAVHFRGVLEEALRVPSQHTFVFLDSLCFVSHIPKPPLAQLINLYLNTSTGLQSDSSQLSRVFTVESLSRLSGESQDASQEKERKVKMSELRDALEETCSSDVDDVNMETETVWRLADDRDWLHCPLGRVSEEDRYLDIDLLAE